MTSRLRKLVNPNDHWVAGLRSVLRKIAAENRRIVVGNGTAGAEFVKHFATRLAIPCEVVSAEVSVDRENATNPQAISLNDQDVCERDRAVLAAADVVYVLHLRSNGNLHRLLRERLEKLVPTNRSDVNDEVKTSTERTSHRHGHSVILVDLPKLQSTIARNELCQLGAQIWQPIAEECPALSVAPKQASTSEETSYEFPSRGQEHRVYSIASFPLSNSWSYLTHTTRSCPGPWPDESFDKYADSLFDRDPMSDHLTLGTLRRIVTQRRLIASPRTIRGGHAVVSFTACPLEQLPSLHRYRPHRVRWDFEPFGLCIRRDWLAKRGVRPVIYGDEATWQSLADVDRPFFQLATGKSGIDWSVESEWRHYDDLDLSELTPEDIILFVPCFEAAKAISEVTPWPITLLSSENFSEI